MKDLSAKLMNLHLETTGSLLEQLSPNDVKRLITDYYANIRLIDLVAKYSLPDDAKQPGAILHALPRYQSEIPCPYDGELMSGEFHAKSAIPWHISVSCNFCSHTQLAVVNIDIHQRLNECTCDNCQATKEDLRIKQIAAQRDAELHAKELRSSIPVHQNTAFQALNLTDFLFLVAWIKTYSDTDLRYLMALSTPILSEETLTTDKQLETISKLAKQGYVGLSKETDLKYITATQDKLTYNVFDVRFTVAGGQAQIREFMALDWQNNVSKRYNTYEDYAELMLQLLQIWHDICLEQLLTYMRIQMEKRTMTAPAGEKTRMLLTSLLKKYSPSQIMYLIWCAARNAGDYWAQSQVSRRQASNSIVGSIQRQEENMVRHNRDIPEFERPKEFIEDPVTRTFFVDVLALPIDGLGAHISLSYLKNRFPYVPKPLI